MRPPIAVIGLAVLLSGCAYASNPFDGFPHYIADTHGLTINPNSPQGRSENMSLARGEAVTAPPLATAPGNVWPAPVQAEPTLKDYEKQIETGTFSPETAQPTTTTGAAPGAPLSLGMPAAPKPLPSPPATLSTVAPVNGDVSTPNGIAHVTTDSNGVITYTLSNGTRGIAVANGDGTLTLIGPDGSVETVKAPK